MDGSVEQVFGPLIGRLLTPEDEKLGPAVAVIGYGCWQRRFGGDPGVIGRSREFRDRSYTIIGVALRRG